MITKFKHRNRSEGDITIHAVISIIDNFPPYQISFIVLSSCLFGLMEIYIGTNTKP